MNTKSNEYIYRGSLLVEPPLCIRRVTFQEGWLLSGVEINAFRYTLSSDLSRGVASHQKGHSKGFPPS